jgi:sugar phosphate isomerase/epimerase
VISISAFKAFPEIPQLALQNNLKLEFTGLVEPIVYSNEFIDNILNSKYANLYHSAHGPFLDLIPPSNDIEVSALAGNKFNRAITACNKLNIHNIIFHNGWIPTFYSDDKWITNSITFWKNIITKSPESMNIHLENVMENNPKLINEIIKGINNPRFSACLDVGHVNVYSSEKITYWFKILNVSIRHIHLHNNYGKEDNHNGLNKGIINIEEVFNNVEKHCPKATINLEIRSDIAESIQMLKNIGKIV